MASNAIVLDLNLYLYHIHNVHKSVKHYIDYDVKINADSPVISCHLAALKGNPRKFSRDSLAVSIKKGLLVKSKVGQAWQIIWICPNFTNDLRYNIIDD